MTANQLQIHFRNLDRSEALEAEIRRHAEKLFEFYDHVIKCCVTVERPHHHQRHGNLFQVRIDLAIPRHELVVNRSPESAQSHEDAYVAVRNAFDAMRRQLQDAIRKERGFVKIHQPATYGRVNQIFPTADYGFLITLEGREIYFHRRSVLNDAFDKLDIGSEVRFVEEAGDRGPQASNVDVVSHHQQSKEPMGRSEV